MPVAGNSSETNNGITIIAMRGTIEGKAPANSKIFIYKNDYNPVLNKPDNSTDSTITNSGGFFSFRVNTGNYTVLCKDTIGLLSFSAISIDTQSLKNDTLIDTLKIPGIFQGSTTEHKSTDSLHSYGYIKGSPFMSQIDKSGECTITELPEGEYHLSFIKLNISFGPVTILDTIENKAIKTIKISSGMTRHVIF
jgi:hypothetical protein